MRRSSLNILQLILLLASGNSACWPEDIQRHCPKADPVSGACLHPWKGDFRSPAEVGMPADEVFFRNASGIRLRGWLFTSDQATQTILFCMGNTGNISLMLPYAKILQDAGYEVLLFDYQGYGASDGVASVNSLLADSLAAFDFLVESRQRKPEEIGIFGVSLGSILALTVAAERQSGPVAVEDVFLPNDQLDRLAARYFKDDNPLGKFAIASIKALLLSRVDPVRNVNRLRAPVFFLHGVNDWLLPVSGTVKTARLCRGPKRVWLMDSTGHAPESLEINDREYASQLQSFFRDSFASRPVGCEVELQTERESGLQRRRRYRVTATITVPSTKRQNEPRDSGPLPMQVALADERGRVHFVRALVNDKRTLQVVLPFKPVFASAVRFHHVDQNAETWVPQLSEYSRALQDFRRLAHRVFGGEANCEFYCGDGSNFYSFQSRLRRLPFVPATQLMNQLPAPKDLPERICGRYAELLARLHCWPRENTAASPEQLKFGEAMLKYLPEQPDDYYEIGNARFQLKFRDSVVCDSLFRLAKNRLRNGLPEEARKLLRLHVALLPAFVQTNLTDERISSIQTINDVEN